MAVSDFTCNKDARVASSGGSNMGSGTSDGLPYGTYSGYKYRTLLGFSVNMAGWTSITQALLYVKSSNQIHVAFGSDPTFVAHRIQAAWSEGSSSGLSTGNAVVYGGPSAAAANAIQKDAPTTENTWTSVDVTAMMRDVLAGAPFYGIRLIGTDNSSVESGSAANVGEIYSRESGSGTAYLHITYETNRAPNAPTVSSPSVDGNGLSGTQTPTFNVNMTDPDGNAINNYNWQIDDNADFSSPIQDVYGGAAGASGVTVGVVPAALPRGGTYYFRVRAADVTVWGGWSTTFQVKIASLPTITVSEPSASGRLARLTYDPGAGWGSPRMVVNWGLTCPDGGTQLNWQVQVYNDAAGAQGSLLNDSGIVANTDSARIVPANLIEGNYYHVVVSGTCSHGLVTVASARRVRVRWGVGVFGADMGAAAIGSLTLTTLDATDENNGGSGKVVIEYQTTATNTAPSVWASTIGGAGLNRYFWYAVYLLSWGPSPAVSPTLNALTITYTTSIIVPDKWTNSDPTNASGDVSSFVYGTKSLRMKGRGNGYSVSQVVDVVPDTNYILSGRVQTQGAGAGRIDLYVNPATVASSPGQAANVEFESPLSRLATGVWNSGNNTQVTVRCINEGPVGTTCWFDAIKLEASTVVTPWSPGYVANAVVLDAGGLSIDASNGGIFRLRGGNGAARSVVELGAGGLVFGGDTGMSSPAVGRMQVGGKDIVFANSQPYRNLVRNGGFRKGTLGWQFFANGDPNATFSLWGQNEQSWGLRDGDADNWHPTNVFGSTVSMFSSSTAAYNPYIMSSRIPVLADETYSLSALLGVHRATDAWASIWFFNNANALIGGYDTNHFNGNTGGQGGNHRDGWNRVFIEGVVAPPNASYAQVVVLMKTPALDLSTVYCFIDQVQMNVGSVAGVYSGGLDDVIGSGGAFPTYPLMGDRFWRTDLNMEFYWSGGSWATTELFLQSGVNDAAQPIAATGAGGRIYFNLPAGISDIWLESLTLGFYVAGGTALSASHKWVGSVSKNGSSGTAGLPSFNIDSGVLGTHRNIRNVIGAALGAGTIVEIDVNMVKTGTPGSLYFQQVAQFRYIAA